MSTRALFQRARQAGAAILQKPEALSALSAEQAVQLRADLAQVEQAPVLRITAARKLQGAQSRRRTGAEALVSSCVEVRDRIAKQFRGATHADLRRAFGTGFCLAATRPYKALALAEKILQAAAAHPQALVKAGVVACRLTRIRRLHAELGPTEGEILRLRRERRELWADLEIAAQRILALCSDGGGCDLSTEGRDAVKT